MINCSASLSKFNLMPFFRDLNPIFVVSNAGQNVAHKQVDSTKLCGTNQNVCIRGSDVHAESCWYPFYSPHYFLWLELQKSWSVSLWGRLM